MKKPYVSQVDKRGKIIIWSVDGSYIRGHIDKEFTNFGQHYRYSYIPVNEFWIDREAKHDETRFFIEHLLVEHLLMSKGVAYNEALTRANMQERKQRRRAGDVSRMTHDGKDLPDAKRVHEKLWKKLDTGLSVWIVNGRLVRSVFDIDFTAGGHEHVYEFVPQNEVWIDNDIEENERGYILLHELHERNLMAKSWTYEKAHEESSKLEYHTRHHPDELHDALTTEGWS